MVVMLYFCPLLVFSQLYALHCLCVRPPSLLRLFILLLQRCTAFDPVTFGGRATNLLLNCLWTHLFEASAAEFLQASANDSARVNVRLRTFVDIFWILKLQLYAVKSALFGHRQRWMVLSENGALTAACCLLLVSCSVDWLTSFPLFGG